MKELHNATLKWAEDRKLLQHGKIQTQMLKLGSEFGELCKNLANNTPIKDDIGDCMVVCTILCALNGKDLLANMEMIKPNIHTTPTVPTAMSYLGLMQDQSIKSQDFTENMINFIHQLEGIAKVRHTSLEEAWAIAYEDIKDRNGALNADGNFIKDTDPAFKYMS